MSECKITGRIGRDPELAGRFDELRTSLVRERERPDGTKTGTIDAIPLRLRGKGSHREAMLLAQKGDLVTIEGNLHIDVWEGKWYPYISVKGMRNHSLESIEKEAPKWLAA